MLLESALADFSTDDSEAFEDGYVVGRFDWASVSGSKSNSPLQHGGVPNNSDVPGGPAEIKHVYLDQKRFSRQSSGPLDSPHQSRKLSDFLGITSRSPPAVDVNCGPSFEITPADDDDLPLTGKEAHSGRGKSPNRRGLKSGADDKISEPWHQRKSFSGDFKRGVSPNRRGLNSGSDDNISLHRRRPSSGDPGKVPFAWEAHSGKPKVQKGSLNHHAEQLQILPAPVVSMSNKKGKGVSTSSPSSQTKDYRKEPLQQGGSSRSWASPKPKEAVKPVYQSTKSLPSGGAKKFTRLDLFKSPPAQRVETHRNRRDADILDDSMNLDYKYYEEESPVSILERPPSPPTTNCSGSSESSVHSPPRAASSAAAPPTPDAAPLPGVASSRRRPSSFSSSCAQDSPRASTSSSARYIGQCLVALKAALAIDPENSKRFQDSFVELDTYGVESPVHAKSEQFDDDDDDDIIVPNEQGGTSSSGWARRGAAAAARYEFEPEYNTMDFYTDSEEELMDDRRSHLSSSRASSLARSSSGSSVSRPMRRSLKYTPVSVENYSLKDKRFLSSHPRSWVDDSISSSLTNSKCNTLTRHQEVSWEEQQADLELSAEEVVRGAVHGLRFTYSPVSSAFVFTRSNEGDEEASSRKASHSRYHQRSPHHRTVTESEASRRFSINLDYETSVYSEDSMSFARASDVTELGLSRAESWSKVARGITVQQQGFQDAVPSSFLRRAGNAMMYEGDGSNRSNQSLGFNSGGGAIVSGTDSRIVTTKRPSKKSGMTTCLPFRAILRNFRTMGSPGRSRLGMAQNSADSQLQWATPAHSMNRLTY
jgi:hypothetical protein